MPRLRRGTEPRGRRIQVYLTAAESEAIEKDASERQMGISRFIRMLALANRPIPSAEVMVLAEELRRIGVNLNQIARQLNQLRIGELEEAWFAELIGAVHETRCRVLGAS